MAKQEQFLLIDSKSMESSAEEGVEGIEGVQGTVAPTGSVRRMWSAVVGSCIVIGLVVCVMRKGVAMEVSSSLVPAVRSTVPAVLKEGSLKNFTQLSGNTCADTCYGHDCNHWSGYSCVDLENTYGCDCNGCSRCTQSSCASDCHGRTCSFWGEHGYSCSILESDYVCNCQHCDCDGPAPAPRPTPTPAPPPSSGNCDNIKPTHHYPLPQKTYTRGLPSPMVAKPSGMTMCEVQQLQQVCIAKINDYRAGAPFSDGRTRDHGSLQSLNMAKTSFAKCMNEKALSDLLYAEHKNQGCGHYTLTDDCGVSGISGHRSENSCCPRGCSSYSQCKRVLLGCLQQMWDEGQIVLDSGSIDWTVQTGHYWNMIGSAYKHAGCGFGFDSHGKMLSTQNFYA